MARGSSVHTCTFKEWLPARSEPERVIKAFKTQNGKKSILSDDAISSPPKYMIDPVLSLQCRAVRMVPLVTFGVPVMTPAESPQDRRRAKMTDRILAILSARDGHGR